MSDKSSSTVTAGPGCLTLMFIVFLTLKLAGIGVVANWSWWWVTAPIWIGAAMGLLVVLAVILVALIGALVDRK